MTTLIENPTTIQAAGTKPKIILEYVGRVNSGTEPVSIAHMKSPASWREPGQRPEFTEYTLVLRGELMVTTEDGAETAVRAAGWDALRRVQGREEATTGNSISTVNASRFMLD